MTDIVRGSSHATFLVFLINVIATLVKKQCQEVVESVCLGMKRVFNIEVIY